jgi:predicted nucleic acid-binding protein
MYLLDTNVLSEMRKDSRTITSSARMDSRVRRWLTHAPAQELYISVVSVLELQRGAHLLHRRHSAQAEVIQRWIGNRILPGFEGRILAVDLTVAQRCASLGLPDPIEYRDSLIAATALVHGMTLVTRNLNHFQRAGVIILNPWD